MNDISNTKFDDFCLKISDTILKWFNIGSSKLCELEKKAFYSDRINIFLIAVIAVSSFLAMLYFDFKTTYAIDDYCYKFVFDDAVMEVTDKRIECFRDIIESMKTHYYHMNGRIIIHTVVSYLLMLDKSVFNVLNALVYVIFTFAIYLNCIGKKHKKYNAVLFLAINLFVWSFVRQWGTTMVWLTGSVNYLWGSTVRLLALLPFRFYADEGKEKHSVLKAIVMFFAGILAGGTNENMSGAFFGMIILYMIYYRIKKYRFRPFFITTLVGTVGSLLFMLLAPGNTSRISYVQEYNLQNTFAQRLVFIPANAIKNIMPMLLTAALFAILLCRYNKGKKNIHYASGFILFAGTVAGTLAMYLSPQFPGRAWFGIIIASIVVAGCFIAQIDKLPVLFRRVCIVFVAGWTLLCATQCVYVMKYSAEDYRNFTAQTESIEEQKAEGKTDVTIEVVTSEHEHTPLYEIYTASDDPEFWLNKALAKYYGVNSVTGVRK